MNNIAKINISQVMILFCSPNVKSQEFTSSTILFPGLDRMKNSTDISSFVFHILRQSARHYCNFHLDLGECKKISFIQNNNELRTI